MSLLNKRVRLVGLSSPGVNGLQGVVSRHIPEKGRYTVLMDDGTSKSIQPVNLEVVGGVSPRGPRPPGPRGFPQGFMPDLGSPQLQELLRRALEVVQPFVQALPVLQGPMGVGLLVALVVLVIKAGLIRGVLVTGVITVGLVNAVPHYRREEGGLQGVKAAVQGVGEALAKQVSRAISDRFNVTPLMGMALMALIAIVLIQMVFSTGDSSGPHSIIDAVEDAYAAGFKDASNNLEYGTSRPLSQQTSIPSIPSSAGSSGFGVSSIFSLGLLAKTGYDLGKTGNGWNPQLALQNVRNLPPLQIALLSFVVVRLLGLSPI